MLVPVLRVRGAAVVDTVAVKAPWPHSARRAVLDQGVGLSRDLLCIGGVQPANGCHEGVT